MANSGLPAVCLFQQVVPQAQGKVIQIKRGALADLLGQRGLCGCRARRNREVLLLAVAENTFSGLRDGGEGQLIREYLASAGTGALFQALSPALA